ncbi:hypothetical protein [Actinoalloteichus hymeniacidonis]|uniref:Uncharacterized protein n=1 Tax=Actinoalloteichus hymeniacidonis TaxID=340345 RepID=A0AAC9HP81_9PSEU|nr:hypothetical protein [Actinoalloteichus hymeniacidonis]AOS62798.1 hypothetical protein TL08_09915 [Actinoalloteichus hymeniacidonis]MBB5909171.1 hypothetical protein [Actinoalloteichus hymeniacidonis]
MNDGFLRNLVRALARNTPAFTPPRPVYADRRPGLRAALARDVAEQAERHAPDDRLDRRSDGDTHAESAGGRRRDSAASINRSPDGRRRPLTASG